MCFRRVRSIAALLATLNLGACSLYLPTIDVAVSVPELPAHWRGAFPQVELRLEHPDGSGPTIIAGAAGQRLELRLPKRLYLPVLARPHLPRWDLELPGAGGVYPLDAAGDTLGLSWALGPAAQLLLELAHANLDLERINVPRLCALMGERGGEDPWNLDLAGIAASLASGQMRESAIRLQPLLDVSLPAGSGDWFLQSPLRLPQRADAQGLVSLQGLSPGFHRLFRADGEIRLDLYASEQEVLWVRR